MLATTAQHLLLSTENGYHSKVNDFTTACLLMVLTNNCEEIFTVQHQ